MIRADPDALHRGDLARAYRRTSIEHNLNDPPDPDAMDAESDPDAGSDAFWHAHRVPDLVWLMRRAMAACLLELGSDGWPDEVSFGVLFTGDSEIADLNGRWRGKPVPTNVLSWPAESLAPGDAPPPHWGELAFAYDVCAREAEERGWAFDAYLAHLTVHGLLHCLGHDHEDDAEAEAMEGAEARILARLGLPDPHAADVE